MSQKITFKRIVSELDDDMDVVEDKKLPVKKRLRKEPPVSKNPLPVADRLHLMLTKARKGM